MFKSFFPQVVAWLNPANYVKHNGYIERFGKYCTTITGKILAHVCIWVGAGIIAFSNPAYCIYALLPCIVDLLCMIFKK